MRIITKLFMITILIAALAAPIESSILGNASTSPTLNKGRKWRIGYYEGGAYKNYTTNLKTIVAGLVKLSWMEPITIPDMTDIEDSEQLWEYLSKHAKSKYLEFKEDAYWSAEWSKEKRALNKNGIIQRLNTQRDIDLILAMGTWAGQDLFNNMHRTPTLAVSVSDPVRSGISATAKDSGLDHFHAKCDPTRYIRQVRLFHRLVKFNKLGVVLEYTAEGRTYAALDDIHQVAQERDFTVVTCDAPISDDKEKKYTDNIIQCHWNLAEKVDAVFVTVHPGIVTERMNELMAPFYAHKIPTWSQRGPDEVKAGALFSVSRGGFKAVGQYYAEVMARVFNGEKPRDINQIFEDPKLVVVNKKVAAMIDFKVPINILRIADEVYETIDQ